VCYEFSPSTSERALDEIRQMMQLGTAMTAALDSTLVEALPNELILLLGILEMKEMERAKMHQPLLHLEEHD
jgi:hypothetical protein